MQHGGPSLLRLGDEGGGAVGGVPHVLKGRVLAVVRELQGAVAAIDLTHLREFSQRHDTGRIRKLQLACLVAALRDVDGAVAHVADGHAAPCILTEAGYKIIRDEAVLVAGEKAARRGLLQVVFVKDAADLKGVEHMRILTCHAVYLPFPPFGGSAQSDNYSHFITL